MVLILRGGPTIDGDRALTVKTNTKVKNTKNKTYVPVRPKTTYKAPPKPKPAPKKAAPKKAAPKKTYVAPKPAPKPVAKASSSSSADSGIKKTNDNPQIKALEELLAKGFAKARDTKLANIKKITGQQDAELLRGYEARTTSLLAADKDNEKSEADASFANLVNRARETGNMLEEFIVQGAGETDMLKAQLMSLRNWDSNQADVNRSYFDTQRSVNTAINDLNATTRTARVNLQTEALADQEQVHTNYYNQRADAYTQLGNIRANPYSDSYKKDAKDYANMAKEASQAWTNPGIDKKILDWNGTVKPTEDTLTNTKVQSMQRQQKIKRPEGSTLRRW